MSAVTSDPTPDPVLQAAVEAFDVPVWRLGDEALAEQLRVLERASRLLTARMVEVAAQAAQRGLPARAGCRRLALWVQRVLPTTTGAKAWRLARRADTLFLAPVAVDLAATRDAFLSGALSGGQTDAITTALVRLLPPAVPAGTVPAEAVAQSQDLLLTQAAHDDAQTLTTVGRRLEALLDPDADDRLARDEQARDHARGLTLGRLRSGMVHVEGLLTPRCGAALGAAIDAWSAPQPAADGTPDPRTGAQRRHDGLQRLTETAVARPGLLPTSHGSPHRVVVTVDHDTLTAALAQEPVTGLPPALLPDGTPLSAASLAEITCGADLVPVLTDLVDNPLDVGDTQYAFPTRQRIAITTRDQHCTWPGCAAPPAWCDVHHLVPFSRGGATAVSNGTLLCGHHHRHVHRAGLIGRLANGAVQWSTGPPADGRGVTRATRALDHLARRWRTHHQV